jgi:hypothetical protein
VRPNNGLRLVLDRLRGANVMVKLEKCKFARPWLKALGHIVDRHGVSSDPEKIRAVRDFLRPPLEGSNAKRFKALRAFLGFLSYYRRFVNGFAMLAKPLHDLVGAKGPMQWVEVAERSFQALKRALEEATWLAHPDNSKPFQIHPRRLRLRDWGDIGPKIGGRGKADRLREPSANES